MVSALSRYRAESKIALRRVAWPLILVLPLAGVSACAGQAPAKNHLILPQSTASSSPGFAAVRYITALYSDNVNVATQFVPPAERALFQYLTKNLSQASVRSENIRVVSTTITRNRASVVLTGTLCAANASPSTVARVGKLQCITNVDAQSAGPLFRISLLKGAANQWYVFYAVPGATPRPQSSAGSRSSSASSP
jgi:hypothetical protein